jgi:hypothetical protein
MKFEQSKFFAHLRNDMFCGDRGELNHFLDFVADIAQRSATRHVFCSGQGAGKGTMVEWLKRMLGREHVLTFSSAQSYFSRFNPDRVNKLVNVMEEISEHGDFFSKHNGGHG